MPLNLTKKVDLFYGRVPLKGDNDKIQLELAKEKEFCAVYVQSDTPSDVHYKTSAQLMRIFGAESNIAQEKGSCIRPFYVVDKDGEELVVMKIGPMKVEKPQGPPRPGGRDLMDARTIYRSIIEGDMKVFDGKVQNDRSAELKTFKAKGLFFNTDIAEAVVAQLEEMGYEVDKKYE